MTARALLRHGLREPTVHFAVIAALLFGVSAAVTSRREVIEIDARAVALRIAEIERGRGGPMNEQERRRAESAYVDEHVLAREARRRRLDDDDRIRSILYQKMLQVLSGDVIQPSQADLDTYYRDTQARYARPAAVTVDDVLVLGDESGARPAHLRDGFDRIEPTPGRLEANVLTRVSLAELSWTLGKDTADVVFAAAPGTWVGPHRTLRGARWFRITERFEAGPPPPLESIRDQVRFDWITEREAALVRARVQSLRDRYRVRVVGQDAAP